MNTQQLECFIKVADKLNFTKAAEELYLSTPTVTHHIKKLEEELNAQLFIRTSKMVQLTQMGQLFYNDAKDILNRIDISQKKISQANLLDISFIRIGCSSYAEMPTIEKILLLMKEQFPHVYPLIFINDYFSLKNLFNNQHLDLMLATKEMIDDIHDCSFKMLKHIHSYALMKPDHPLAKKSTLTFDDLQDTMVMTLNPRFIPFQQGNKLQEKLTLYMQSHFHIRCENDQASLLMAKCGYGIAILPAHSIPENIEGLCQIPIEAETSIQYGLAYRHDHNDPCIQYILKHISG